MNIGFIGFGEAAQAMASGFQEAGTRAPRLTAFDIRVTDPTQKPLIEQSAAARGVILVRSEASAIASADVIFSLVQGSASVAVARKVGPHLIAGQTFVDLNSTGPHTKSEVAEAIATGSGRCLDGAVMDAVKPHKHRVPILLAGPQADDLANSLNSLGMRCEAVSDTVGAASAVKMIRSVMIKGIEALILEAMEAAERTGVTERILTSLNTTFDGLDWRRLTSHYLRRSHEHGPRRVAEMKQSAQTLERLGLTPIMCRAIAVTIQSGHERLSGVPYEPAETYQRVLPILAALNTGKSMETPS
jgi:3-hydroxyisobutyrate dehydrogenase-like beta-hydroxyacid dehydrogenase